MTANFYSIQNPHFLYAEGHGRGMHCREHSVEIRRGAILLPENTEKLKKTESSELGLIQLNC